MRTMARLVEEGLLIVAGGVLYLLDSARHLAWSLTSASRKATMRRRVNEALVYWRVRE